MTLIEVLIVLVVFVLIAGGMTYSLTALTRARLRSACMTITAASRFAYNRSISEDATVRLVFDLDTDQMSFEEANGGVTLTRLHDERRREIEDDDDDHLHDTTAVDPWAASVARLRDPLHPTFGASPFHPVPGSRYTAHALASNIAIERLIVPHEPEPRTEGRGAIYFFPGGQTEHAVVWLSDGNDRIYSIEIHPLTGRARVYTYAYEPEEMLDDGEGNVRSELRN